MVAEKKQKKVGKALQRVRGALPAPAPEVPEDRHDLRILQSLRRIIRAAEIHSRRLVAFYDLTGPQLACLQELLAHGPLTSTRLSRLLYLSPSTVVGIVDRLEEKGWVGRRRDVDDRRVVVVSLTAPGERVAASAPPSLRETLAAAVNGLSDLERVTIALGLEKVVQLMEADKLSAAPFLDPGPINPPPTG